MSALHTSRPAQDNARPAQDNVVFPPTGSGGASESSEGPLAQRLSRMKAAWESLASEIADELKSIGSILWDTSARDAFARDASASDASFEAAAGWEAARVPQPAPRHSPEPAAPPAEARPGVRGGLNRSAPRDALKESSSENTLPGASSGDALQGSSPDDALKGHDRLAALKARLAEKLRCESDGPARERPRGDLAFAGKEDEQS